MQYFGISICQRIHQRLPLKTSETIIWEIGWNDVVLVSTSLTFIEFPSFLPMFIFLTSNKSSLNLAFNIKRISTNWWIFTSSSIIINLGFSDYFRGNRSVDSRSENWRLSPGHQDLYQKHCVKSGRIRSIFVPYIPAFGLNTERYSICLHLQFKCGKIWTRKTPNTYTYHRVKHSKVFKYKIKRPWKILLVSAIRSFKNFDENWNFKYILWKFWFYDNFMVLNPVTPCFLTLEF